MGECRFDGEHYPVICGEHSTPESLVLPALCTHAAAEVEKLREVARVLQNTTPEALRQLVTELFMQGRSAWAYLFTDLATSLDALAVLGEEGKHGPHRE